MGGFSAGLKSTAPGVRLRDWLAPPETRSVATRHDELCEFPRRAEPCLALRKRASTCRFLRGPPDDRATPWLSSRLFSAFWCSVVGIWHPTDEVTV